MKLFRQSQYGDLLNLYHEWLCLLPLLKLTIQLWFSIKHSVNWCRFFFGTGILIYYIDIMSLQRLSTWCPFFQFLEIIKMMIDKAGNLSGETSPVKNEPELK